MLPEWHCRNLQNGYQTLPHQTYSPDLSNTDKQFFKHLNIFYAKKYSKRYVTITHVSTRACIHPSNTSMRKNWYTIPTVFDFIFRFFGFLHFLSLSAWWLLFVKLHETQGRRQTSIAPAWVLSTLAREFTAATRKMQSSSNELSTLVSGGV